MWGAKLMNSTSSSGADAALRSTPGRANFQRVSRLLISGGTTLLRETFDSICIPSILPLKLNDPAVKNKLKAARLTKPQWDCLYPSPGVYGKSTDFDITLLFKLFRNTGFLSPPCTGWNRQPNKTDLSLTADILRLTFKRNSVAHVNENMEIANDDFPGLWSEISEILLRIAGNISVARRDEWQKAIKQFSNEHLTPEHERCVEELLRWYRSDMDVKKSLEEVKACLESVQSEAQDIKVQLGQINEAIGGLSSSSSTGACLHLCISCEAIAGLTADSGTSQMEETSQQHQVELQREEALAPVTVFQPQAKEARATPGRKRGFPSEQDVLNLIAVKYLYNDELSSPNAFLQYLTKVRKVLILGVGQGSLLITVECGSLQILDELWEDYHIGHLNAMAQDFLVTADVLKELGLSKVKLRTTILEQEYRSCREYFLHNSEHFWRSQPKSEQSYREIVSTEIMSGSSRDDKMAVPLCLPSNCKWNARTGECIKTGEERSSLYVVDEALQQLRTIRGPVCVVSIAGPFRNGKSFALSEAFNQPEVFPLGHHMDPETMGIWLWVVPEKIKDSNGRECTVVLLDSEGIDAVRGEGFDDNQIFTLTVLLASVLIYNSTGVPTRNDLNGLDFIVKLSQRIQLRSSKDPMGATGHRSDTESFHKTFPFFIWLLRDVTQSVPPDCKDIQEYFLTRVFKQQGHSSADQNQKVAESILRFFPGFRVFKLPPPTSDEEVLNNIQRHRSQLNPTFLSGLEQFKGLLGSVLAPKHSFNDGEFVTGEGLAALIQLYVEAINTPGVIPNIQSAWDTFVGNKCSEAQLTALRTYEALMTSQLSGQLPCDNDVIRQCHDAALEEGIRQLEADTFGISSITIERCLKELTESTTTTLSSWTRENEKLTRESCIKLLAELKRQHLDPVLAQLHGPDVSKVSFDDIVGGYKGIEQDFQNRARGAKDVCAAVFFEFHPELMREMQQYLGMLRQMKDFDENLTREIAAKAYQEQEKKRLEEEYARLQQENRERQKEMEMLSAKQDEERARLREQFEAEGKAQRDQMENMTKASMELAEKERRAFMQENQSLQQRVVEMQKSNEGMQRNMQNLQQQMAANQNRQEDVKKPGFFDKALSFVTGVGSVLGAVATAVPKCSIM